MSIEPRSIQAVQLLRLFKSAAAISAIASPTLAQQTTTVTGVPSCRACRIELVPIVTLSVPDSVEPIGRTPIAADSSGQYYVLARGGLKVYTFSRDGRFSGSFGRAGDGPGEVKRISLIGVLP